MPSEEEERVEMECFSSWGCCSHRISLVLYRHWGIYVDRGNFL